MDAEIFVIVMPDAKKANFDVMIKASDIFGISFSSLWLRPVHSTGFQDAKAPITNYVFWEISLRAQRNAIWN